MIDQDFDVDDDTSEASFSESSSSVEGAIFKPQAPFVLELHGIKKDDPAIPTLEPTGAKIKKQRKKKKAGVTDKSHSSLSSDSLSEASSIAPSIIEGKEEFYDAHESYYAIPENQIPFTVAARMVTQPETIRDPKAPNVVASPQPQTTMPGSQKDTSPIIIKPTAPS